VSSQRQLTSSIFDHDSLSPTAEEIRLLRLRLDEIVELEAHRLRASSRRRPSERDLCTIAGKMYDARRARDRILDCELFGEPAWDMLLALYALPARGFIMTVKALSCSANVPISTGHRWQKTLTEEGFIERGPQGVDHRKQIVRLTAKGRALLDEYLTRLFYLDLPAPSKPDAIGD
jgi:DNA-binding MarR family transcriptional regulator